MFTLTLRRSYFRIVGANQRFLIPPFRSPTRIRPPTRTPILKPTTMSTASDKSNLDPNQGGDATKKSYHKSPTGAALQTANAHSADHDLQLYGSCF